MNYTNERFGSSAWIDCEITRNYPWNPSFSNVWNDLVGSSEIQMPNITSTITTVKSRLRIPFNRHIIWGQCIIEYSPAPRKTADAILNHSINQLIL